MAIILDSPFTSAADVARLRYWYLPVGLLMKDQFRSLDFAPRVTVPVFVLHGTADRIVPYVQGRRLFEAFTAPKEFLTLQDGNHIDPLTEVSWGAIKAFLMIHDAAP